jgi:hypothetical protein
MTTDLEADLRHEFDAASAPSSLMFNPDAVMQQGSQTIRRRRLVAVASCAAAVALVATGATLMSQPHNTATPQPAKTASTGIVRSSLGQFPLSGEVEFNRDPAVKVNVKFFATPDDRKPRHQVAAFSVGKPGQKPDAVWKSGMEQGHPFTFGLVPGRDFEINLAHGAGTRYGVSSDEVKGTDYSSFAVTYQNGNEKEAARPAWIADISWVGPGGIVDGIEGNHRLTGRVLTIDRAVSVKVMLRPGNGGRSTVVAQVRRKGDSVTYGIPLKVTPTDASGVAIVTGRYSINRQYSKDITRGSIVVDDGAPLATGILPPGATHIGVILKSGKATRPIIAQAGMPDGKVIFLIQTDSDKLSQPSKISIKTVTWTNADGSQGRRDVNQKVAQKYSPKQP